MLKSSTFLSCTKGIYSTLLQLSNYLYHLIQTFSEICLKHFGFVGFQAMREL